jgi:hypothetical protein
MAQALGWVLAGSEHTTFVILELLNGEGRVYLNRDHWLESGYWSWPPSTLLRFEIVTVDGMALRQARDARYEFKPHDARCAVGLIFFAPVEVVTWSRLSIDGGFHPALVVVPGRLRRS